MGNNIGYTDKEGSHYGERIGTNGSGQALMGLFAVAYASCNHADSIRARRSVKITQGAREANPTVDIPFFASKTEDIHKLLELDGDKCFWVEFQIKTAGSGFFQTPPKCTLFEGVLIPLILEQACNGNMLIPPGTVLDKVAEAWEKMLPVLEKSPAYETLAAMAKYAREAADGNYALRMH